MKHLEDTPWYICNENDKNLCAYVDTDSNYFNTEPLLKHLYPNFEELSDDEDDSDFNSDEQLDVDGNDYTSEESDYDDACEGETDEEEQ